MFCFLLEKKSKNSDYILGKQKASSDLVSNKLVNKNEEEK